MTSELGELRTTAVTALLDYLDAVVVTGQNPMLAIGTLMAEIQQKAGGTPNAA